MLIILLFIILLQHSSVCSQFHDEQVGVFVRVKLQGYSNPTCLCSTPDNCSLECSVLVSLKYPMEDGAVHQFLTLDVDGELKQAPIYTFHDIFIILVPTQPSFVKMSAKTLGTFMTADGETLQSDSFQQIDKFVIPLTNVTPSKFEIPTIHQNQYVGKPYGSTLSVSLVIACPIPFVGPLCDLKCNNSDNNSDLVRCVSVVTGDFSICKSLPNGQVDKCQKVPLEVSKDSIEKSRRKEQYHRGLKRKSNQLPIEKEKVKKNNVFDTEPIFL